MLDLSSPAASGLVWSAPFWEGAGARVVDLIAQNNLAVSSSSTPPPWVCSNSPTLGSGVCLNLTAATCTSLLPQQLQIGPPITFVFGMRVVSTPPADFIFGIYPDVSGSHYTTVLAFSASGGVIRLVGQNSGSPIGANTTFVPTIGVDYVIVAVFGKTSWQFYAYTNGALVTAQSGSWTINTPTYLSTAKFGFGSVVGSSSPLNCTFYFGDIYNRALTAAEANYRGRLPWCNFAPRITAAMLGTLPRFTASPTSIPANHAGNITLTLSGSGTAWNGSTTVFTVSGVAGLTKVSQSVTSATSATLVVATGSGTGGAHDCRWHRYEPERRDRRLDVVLDLTKHGNLPRPGERHGNWRQHRLDSADTVDAVLDAGAQRRLDQLGHGAFGYLGDVYPESRDGQGQPGGDR